MMVFELWEFENGHSFFERAADAVTYHNQLQTFVVDEPNAKHVWTVEAHNYNEAMQALYDYKGWGRYHPFEEEINDSKST